MSTRKPPAGAGSSGSGRAHVARDAEHEQRAPDRALPHPPPRLRPARVEAPVVADLDDELGTRRPRPPAPPPARRRWSRPASRGRGACPASSTAHGPGGVVDRPGRERRPRRRRRRRAAPRRCRRRTPSSAPTAAALAGPRRGDRDELRPGEALHVARMERPMPPRPATPSLVTLDTAGPTMTASQSLAQPFEEREGDHARRRRRACRRLRVDGLARPERRRRAVRPDPRGRAARPRTS